MSELRKIGTVFTEHYRTYQKEDGELGQSYPVNEKYYARTFRVVDHRLGQFGKMVEVLEPLDEVN